MRTSAIALVALLLGQAQQPPQPRAPGALTQGVTAVLVDIVVRDRRGEPVKDLTQADVQVLEDGVPQQIGSFTTFSDGKAPPVSAVVPGAASGSTSGGPNSLASVGDSRILVTAWVFDRLGPEARALAVQAARSYLADKQELENYIGIFGVDIGFAAYAPFTRNPRIARQALDKLALRASASFNNPEQQQRQSNADRQAADAAQQVAAITAAAGPGASTAMGGTPGDAALAQMAANIERDFELMERDQQGYSTTNGLLSVINSMRPLPGRKNLVLFSEGVAIPSAVQRLFAGVIDAANRANVSIYAMDAKGLRAESEQARIRDQVNRAAGGGAGILGSGVAGDQPLTKVLERNEDVLRQDPHTGLGMLAKDTGGLLFDSSNNLRQGFERIENDLRNYYLVGYMPSNDNYDGRFRTIEVKVNRPGVTVAARKGYYAVRNPTGTLINAWEAPALAALDRKPVPNAFPVRTGALLFPERDRPGLVALVVSVRTAPLTFQPSADGKTYTSDFSVLVRLLDRTNRPVRKLSEQYQINGALSELEGARRGEVIFYREPELSAGVYTVEAVVHDAPSGRSSVRFATVEVPPAAPEKLRMSSLILVRRAEKVSEKERRAENPLLVDDLVLYPNLGEPVSRSATEVAFYFVAYPTAGGPPPNAFIELLQNGNPMTTIPLPLRAADKAGRIRQLARLRLDRVAPGTYELRAVVSQGSVQVVRSTTLQVTDEP